jgi:alanyl-tRNA synthetase
MSSERLYYTDAYLVEFDAVVRDTVEENGRWKVFLDRSAFYPTSGGQPHDTGTLGDANVVDVVEQEDGTVAHFVDRPLEKNSRVRGHIEWVRRFDHMQQHTGQHVLSASCEKEAGAKTVSFHLGAAASTIDLDKELSADDLARVEDAANAVLWQDREVCVKFVTASEAAKLPLRKEPVRTGELRVIEIQDHDLSACGGTHVARTGAIGVIAITGHERFKGGQRIEFVCGSRAVRAFRRLKSVVHGSVRLLSVLPDEVPPAIEKLLLSARDQQKSQETLQGRLAEHEAARLRSTAEEVGNVRAIAAAVSGWDAAGLKKLASAVASGSSSIAVLLSDTSPALAVVSRSPDVNLDAGWILGKLLERFGGKGGGKGAMAQGGGLTGNVQEMLAVARAEIRAALSG